MYGSNSMSRLCFAAGMISFIFSICCFVYPIFGLFFGSLAILFGILSRERNGSMPRQSLTGILFGSGGMIINTLLIISVVIFLCVPGNFRKVMDNVDSIYEEYYGESYTEMFEELYGIELPGSDETGQ